MATATIPADMNVQGYMRATRFFLASGGTATDPGDMGHQHSKSYGQTGTAVAATIPIHIVAGATGTLRAIKCALVAACTGNATVSVDVKVNGTTVLSAPMSLTLTETAYEVVAGTISSADVVTDDVITVVVVVSAGTGALGTGLAALVVLDEDYVS